jgi:hypothetical protein
MKNKGNLRVGSACPTLIKKVVRMLEGERHHFKGRNFHMEAIQNLCASRNVAHKNHAIGA